MIKHLKNHGKLYIGIAAVLIAVFIYFFLPRTFKLSDEEKIYIQIDKEIDGISHYYVLNEQETDELTAIFKKSRFYRGVSKPDNMFSDKSVHVIVQGNLSPIIRIYYDTEKTYVFANISTGMFLNIHHRISNSKEIKNFVETILNTKTNEFTKTPVK